MSSKAPTVHDSSVAERRFANTNEQLMSSLGKPGLARLDEFLTRRDRVFAELPEGSLRTLRRFVELASSDSRDERRVVLERWVSGAPLNPGMLRFADELNCFTEIAEHLLATRAVVSDFSLLEYFQSLSGDVDGGGEYGLRGLVLPASLYVVDDGIAQHQVDALEAALKKVGLEVGPIVRRADYLANRDEFVGWRERQFVFDQQSRHVNARNWQQALNNKYVQQCVFGHLPGVPPMLTAGFAGTLATGAVPDDALSFVKLPTSASGSGVKPIHSHDDLARYRKDLSDDSWMFVQRAAFNERDLGGAKTEEVSVNLGLASSGFLAVAATEQNVVDCVHQGNRIPNPEISPSSLHVAEGVAAHIVRMLHASASPPETRNQIFGVDLLQAAEIGQAAFLETNFRETGVSALLAATLRMGATASIASAGSNKIYAPTVDAIVDQVDALNTSPKRVVVPTLIARSGRGGYKAEIATIDR